MSYISATSPVGNFYTTLIEMLKSSSTFQQRLVTYTDAESSDDLEQAVEDHLFDDTSSEIAAAIGDSGDYPLISELCPYAIVYHQDHTEQNTGGQCNAAFDAMGMRISVLFVDEARLNSTSDGKFDSYIDFQNFYGGVINDIKNNMSDQTRWFDTITKAAGPDRTPPHQRNSNGNDFWTAGYDFICTPEGFGE